MQQKRISTFISKIICISLLLSAATNIQAQKVTTNNIALPKDTTRLFTHIAFSVDAISAAQQLFVDYGQYEAALRISLRNKYFPIIEVGYAQADSEEPLSKMHYNTKAPYGRIGVDYNVLKIKDDNYRLYVGARYAFTAFRYSVKHPDITDPVYKTTVPFQLVNIQNQTHWVEAVFGVDAKIWGPLRLGWTVRYKQTIVNTSSNNTGNPWYIPGYGKMKGAPFGGTFNLILEI